MESPLAEREPAEVISKLLKTVLSLLALSIPSSQENYIYTWLRPTLYISFILSSVGDIIAVLPCGFRYGLIEHISESSITIIILLFKCVAFSCGICVLAFSEATQFNDRKTRSKEKAWKTRLMNMSLTLLRNKIHHVVELHKTKFNNRNTHTDNPKEGRPIRTSCKVLQPEVDRLAEPQTKNCTTNSMVKKIQTGEEQEVSDKPVTQHHNENMHIEEVIYDMQKLEKEMSDLELKKEGQHKTKKLERKEQLKVNQQKLKHELPDVKNEQTKFKMDVQQQQLYTAQLELG